MIERSVTFRYVPGLGQDLFRNGVLVGSWDASGRATSGPWSRRPMEKVRGADGCPVFTATVALQADSPEQSWRWGVELDGPAGEKLWAIITEEQHARPADCVRWFRLDGAATGGTQEEVYFLSQARRLGAQKHFADPQGLKKAPGIRFAVWAPNARRVEVVFGDLWEAGGGAQARTSLIDPQRSPALRSVERGKIRGGYIGEAIPPTPGPGVHPGWKPLPMTRDAQGIWSTDPRDPALADFSRFDHLPYMFRVFKDDGTAAYRTDLYSRCQIGFGDIRPEGLYQDGPQDLDGSVSCSVVVDPDRVCEQLDEPVYPETRWREQAAFFADPAPHPSLAGLGLRDLVIYELHVGALGFQSQKPDWPGTLADACALLDHLQELGVNAVELLPLSEFGGDCGGWGYATSHYLAIEYSGGGRDQYKWFIRECHRRGMAVILDVVYNHYHHQADRAQWMFDTGAHDKNAYYWYEGRPEDHAEADARVPPGQRGHGGYLDNESSGYAPRYHEEMVRSLFISSALALATEFQVDGLRVDQTTSIRSYNVVHAEHVLFPGRGRRHEGANAFGAKLLRELTRALRLVKPGMFLMAEDHESWSGLTQPVARGGLGFDAGWYADFYHHLVGDTDKGDDYAKLIETAGLGDDRPLRMDHFAGALQATQGGDKVVYHESHDEAGNGRFTGRTIRVAVNGAPLVGDTRRAAEARCRFAAGMTLLSAGVPMFLFGEEVGAEKPFLYGRVLENREDLAGLRQGIGQGLFTFYADLIRLRRSRPALTGPDIDVVFVHNADRLIAFRRPHPGGELLVVGSLHNRAFASPGYELRADRLPGGRWREIFNSDAARYGGDNVGNQGAVLDSPGRFSCVLPARGFLVFERSEANRNS